MRANGRILVVEDDPDWVETYRSVLAVDDYEVVAASDSAAARALLAQDSDWDVIILDMNCAARTGPKMAST